MGRLFVITGPSGVGKGTLLAALRDRFPALVFPVSATTRPPRPGELNGVDYHFVSEERFGELDRSQAFVESARYGGHRYGTLLSELAQPLSDGLTVILEIELEGARQVRAAFPEATTIFIRPPDSETLRKRLSGRGTEDTASVAGRLERAQVELAAEGEFDHSLTNDVFEAALNELVVLIETELGSARFVAN